MFSIKKINFRKICGRKFQEQLDPLQDAPCPCLVCVHSQTHMAGLSCIDTDKYSFWQIQNASFWHGRVSAKTGSQALDISSQGYKEAMYFFLSSSETKQPGLFSWIWKLRFYSHPPHECQQKTLLSDCSLLDTARLWSARIPFLILIKQLHTVERASVQCLKLHFVKRVQTRLGSEGEMQ